MSGDLSAFLGALRRPLRDMPGDLVMRPLPRAFDAAITPPGSKSIANRALVLALLDAGETTLVNVPEDADDIAVTLGALPALGAHIERLAPGRFRVAGVAGKPRGGASLDLHNAGTATRFLAAVALLSPEPTTIDGDARMRQRPIGELADALRALGASVEFLGAPGFPPVRIAGPAVPRRIPASIMFGRTQSSQFISAIMLVAPFLPGGLDVRTGDNPTSAPYIAMTRRMVERFRPSAGSPGAPRTFTIEPDASGATYFWAAAAITPGARCRVPGLTREGLQGDVRFVETLARMGACVDYEQIAVTVSSPPAGQGLRAIDTDLSDMPDAAMTLGAVACFADGPTTIRGLRTLRVKETDRLAALQTELTKTGARVEIIRAPASDGSPDEALRITPAPLSAPAPPVEFDTYNDHRMAMSLALIGLRRPGVLIRDPACVAKTYPSFWRDLASLYD